MGIIHPATRCSTPRGMWLSTQRMILFILQRCVVDDGVEFLLCNG